MMVSWPTDMAGERPAPLHTGWARVALTRLGFIAPTAAAGGDAVPLHDTDREQVIDWMFSPVTPPTCSEHLRHRETIVLGDLEPIERSAEPDLTQSPPPFIEPSPLTRWTRRFPWSLLLAVGGLAAVRVTVIAAGLSGSPVATAAVASVQLCGALLVAAQLMDRRTR